MILLDTSGLLAAIDGSQRDHAAAADVLARSPGPRLLSPFVLAELDYLITTRISPSAARSVLGLVAGGAFRLEPMSAGDIASAASVIDRFGDQSIGLADASIVVLALRYGVRDVLTLDERHFRVLRGPGDEPFRLLPRDA